MPVCCPTRRLHIQCYACGLAARALRNQPDPEVLQACVFGWHPYFGKAVREEEGYDMRCLQMALAEATEVGRQQLMTEEVLKASQAWCQCMYTLIRLTGGRVLACTSVLHDLHHHVCWQRRYHLMTYS